MLVGATDGIKPHTIPLHTTTTRSKPPFICCLMRSRPQGCQALLGVTAFSVLIHPAIPHIGLGIYGPG